MRVVSQLDLPAGQNPSLIRGQSRFFGAFRDEQNRIRFRFPVDQIEVAGLRIPRPYYFFLREMALDRILRRDIDPERLAAKAVAYLRKHRPLTPVVLGTKV